MTTETVLKERPAESTRAFAFEISEEALQGLRSEYARLSGEANRTIDSNTSNPGPLSWDDYLCTTLSIGLEHLRAMSDAEVLALLEREMLG